MITRLRVAVFAAVLGCSAVALADVPCHVDLTLMSSDVWLIVDPHAWQQQIWSQFGVGFDCDRGDSWGCYFTYSGVLSIWDGSIQDYVPICQFGSGGPGWAQCNVSPAVTTGPQYWGDYSPGRYKIEYAFYQARFWAGEKGANMEYFTVPDMLFGQ